MYPVWWGLHDTHFSTSGFNIRFPRTPQNENKNLKKISSDYFHILHIVELWCDFKKFVGPWSIYIYIKCLWVLLTNVYWFRATGGYICGCGRPSNLVVKRGVRYVFCVVFHARWIFLTTSLRIPPTELLATRVGFGDEWWEKSISHENPHKIYLLAYFTLQCRLIKLNRATLKIVKTMWDGSISQLFSTWEKVGSMREIMQNNRLISITYMFLKSMAGTHHESENLLQFCNIN